MRTSVKKPRVGIIGGGIWGLSCAFFLEKKSAGLIDVVVLEGTDRPGGMIQTREFANHRMEMGPNGFLDSNPSTFDLCKELDLQQELLPASASAARNRYLYLKNRLHKLPSNLFGMAFSPVLSIRGKLQILTEGLRTKRAIPEEESIADFFRARVGNEVACSLGDAFVTGIWGGDSEELSLPSCFPKWREMEISHGSILRGLKARRIAKSRVAREAGLAKPPSPRMWSLKKGLGQLIDTLAVHLGSRLRIHQKVSALQPVLGQPRAEWRVFIDGQEKPETFDHVILACPAHEQARLLAPYSPALANTLLEIPTTPIAVIGLLFPESQICGDAVKPDGFGYLTPQKDGRPVMGVQWCSAIFPGHRSPPGWHLWRALVGGPNQSQLLDLNDETLTKVVLAELKTVGNWALNPECVHIFRWKRAIPQYTLGHAKRTQAILEAQKTLPGLNCAGSCMGGVAINDCVEQSAKLAAGLVESLTKISG